jgi:hypothetical protein
MTAERREAENRRHHGPTGRRDSLGFREGSQATVSRTLPRFENSRNVEMTVSGFSGGLSAFENSQNVKALSRQEA